MKIQAYIIFSDEKPNLSLEDRVMEVLLDKEHVDSIVSSSNGLLWSKAVLISI